MALPVFEAEKWFRLRRNGFLPRENSLLSDHNSTDANINTQMTSQSPFQNPSLFKSTIMVVPSDDNIRAKMVEMMKVTDLETMSTKQFISALSAKYGGADLSARKKFIKATITEIIDSMAKDAEGDDDDDDAAADGDGGSDDESSDDEEEEVDLKPKKKGSGGGLSAVKEISDELAAFLGSGKHMARTSIVKSLWEYIKKNNLQTPGDKREILLDNKMKTVFGVETFTVCPGIIRSDLM